MWSNAANTNKDDFKIPHAHAHENIVWESELSGRSFEPSILTN